MITEEALRFNRQEVEKALRGARQRKERAVQIYAEAEVSLHRAGADVAALEFSLECIACVASVVFGEKQAAPP